MWSLIKSISIIIPFLLVGPALSADYIVLQTREGDTIKGRPTFGDIHLETKYGKLTLPIKDVRRVLFTMHYSTETANKIDSAVKDLGSANHKSREAAVKTLVDLGRYSYHKLRSLESSDLEVMKRREIAVVKITEKFSMADLQNPDEDIVETDSLTFQGKIADAGFKFKNIYFGDMSLNPSELRNISFIAQLDKTFTMNAKESGQWIDVGIMMNVASKVLITAEGAVDIFPGQPGQYLAGPWGYKQHDGQIALHQGTGLPSGALAAKIVKPSSGVNSGFVVAESKLLTGNEGRLYLMIVPSLWNSPSSGSYSVKIRSEN